MLASPVPFKQSRPALRHQRSIGMAKPTAIRLVARMFFAGAALLCPFTEQQVRPSGMTRRESFLVAIMGHCATPASAAASDGTSISTVHRSVFRSATQVLERYEFILSRIFVFPRRGVV
jgi:hypothetical protein